MYRVIFALLLIVMLGSCTASKVLPLSSNYPSNPVITKHLAGVSRDEVWSRTIRFFADHDLPVKTIDQGSGFIQTDMISFVGAYQIDRDSTQVPFAPYVIAAREKALGMTIQPSYIVGYLKIFVLPEGSAEIRVSIEDLRSFHMLDVRHSHSSVVTHNEIQRSIVSTALFENQVCQSLSTGIDTTGLSIQKGEILNPKSNYAQYIKKKSHVILGSFFAGEFGAAGILISAVALTAKKH